MFVEIDEIVQQWGQTCCVFLCCWKLCVEVTGFWFEKSLDRR